MVSSKSENSAAPGGPETGQNARIAAYRAEIGALKAELEASEASRRALMLEVKQAATLSAVLKDKLTHSRAALAGGLRHGLALSAQWLRGRIRR
ncbi:hypothetical protein [Pacificoceanicola onchidii]|uniref:hypothetical protein n=1 Tax=Pacificoceanicola onchidii TaxID=2562685 RepID=UPI0010A34414|nr:hypothetical protein [Pacificoceanicola onchidii]